MTALAAGSNHVDVVFLGSSSMDQAVNPLVFNSTSSGLTAYNASLNGLTMRSLEIWALEVVLPTLDPEVVVLGVTTRELNDGSTERPGLFDQLPTSRGLREFGTEGGIRLISTAEDLSALLRIREGLRRPFSLALKLFGYDRGEVSSLPGPFGQRIPEERDFTYDFSDRWREEWSAGDMRDFAMGGVEFEALKRSVAAMRDQGRYVVLMPLPVSSDYASVQPGGLTSLSAFRDLLSSVAGPPGVTIIEPTIQFQSQDFRDPAHLGPVAAEEFATLLAQELEILHLALFADSVAANK
jgi:hypothetical protein